MNMGWYGKVGCVGSHSIFGNGPLQRYIGLGVDSIISATVLLANGTIV
jgi:hypothetical protein